MNTIGIIGAMADEVAFLKAQMQGVTVHTKAAMDFYEGTLEGHHAVVVCSGIGKVNAALCTQIVVDVFSVDGVINTGIAGSLKNEVNIGDIVLATDVVQHDVNAVNFGYPIGQIPRMDTLTFPADASLRELAQKVCEQVNPDIQVFCGRIASGDQFISDQNVKDEIKKNFDAYCVEMEGAAIGQAAYLNRVPFLVVRAISDKADNSATVDYPTFEKKAIEHCTNLTKNIVKML